MSARLESLLDTERLADCQANDEKLAVSAGFSTAIDMSGRYYGRLLVLTDLGRLAGSSVLTWLCLCECGRVIAAKGSLLRGGVVKSCGCLRRETASATGRSTTKHGMCRTATYNVWNGMLSRCYDKAAKDYHRYGGRGIDVCERWRASFVNFFADMGERPSGLSLDRIDNSKGYSPENCRWATTKQRARNRKTTVWVMLDGKPMTLPDAVELKGWKYGTAFAAIRKRGAYRDMTRIVIETTTQESKQ